MNTVLQQCIPGQTVSRVQKLTSLLVGSTLLEAARDVRSVASFSYIQGSEVGGTEGVRVSSTIQQDLCCAKISSCCTEHQGCDA